MNGGREDLLKPVFTHLGSGPRPRGESGEGSEERLTSELGVRAGSLEDRGQLPQLRPGGGCGQESAGRRAGGRGPRQAQSFPLGFPGFKSPG